MNLNKCLHATDKFIELEPLIERVKSDISFWGIRYVYLDGSNDRFPIDILATRVMELVQKKQFEYSSQERTAGKKIAAKIDQIYKNNEEMLKTKWLITQYLCYFIDSCRSGGYHVGFFWKVGGNKNVFEYYTERQYQKEFHELDKDLLEKDLLFKWFGDRDVETKKLYRKVY